MALVIPKSLHPNPARLRSYLLRLPLFTRLTIALITLFWIIGLQSLWGLVRWGQLKPSEMNLSSSGYTPFAYGSVGWALEVVSVPFTDDSIYDYSVPH
jgi:hypothetical protein